MTLVGMTYDLRTDYLQEGYTEEETAEFDQPATIEAIEETLQSLGYRTDRIGHVRALAKRLVAGDRWDLVFNIAEGVRGFGREAQVPCLLDAYGVPYVFSDPLVLSLTLHKAMAKRVVRDLGIPTPDFAVVEDVSDIAGVSLPYPLFVKPVSEGTGKGIDAKSLVRDSPLSPVRKARFGGHREGHRRKVDRTRRRRVRPALPVPARDLFAAGSRGDLPRGSRIHRGDRRDGPQGTRHRRHGGPVAGIGGERRLFPDE